MQGHLDQVIEAHGMPIMSHDSCDCRNLQHLLTSFVIKIYHVILKIRKNELWNEPAAVNTGLRSVNSTNDVATNQILRV